MPGTEIYILILALLLLLIIRRITPLFINSRITEYYSANLAPTEVNEYISNGKGRIERIYYEDGNSELRMRLNGTDFPAGTRLKINVNGYTIREIQSRNGDAYMKIDSRDGLSVPYIGNGDVVEILLVDRPVMKGVAEKG